MDLPTNVSTGMVTGQYIADIIDGADPNQEPDAIPAQGRIVFTKSVPYLPNPTADPNPVTIMQVPIVGVLDAEGYLCTPAPGTEDPLYRGVKLIATDDPDLSVTDWTWDVTYFFDPVNGHKLAIPAHGFALPSGMVVDLTKVAKVPSSPGYSLPQAEAAVLRAEALVADAVLEASASAVSAAEAVAAAERAEQVAGATDTGVAALLGDTATATGELLDGMLAGKADSADVAVVLDQKADKTAVDSSLATKANSVDVTTALADKADQSLLAGKADLEDGVVPIWQLPTGALVTDQTVAAQINAAQTGAAIDQRITTQVTPMVEPVVADYIASQPAVVDAAAAAVDANPAIASLETKNVSQDAAIVAATPWKGAMPNGSDLFTLARGIYTITSTVNAGTMINLPEVQPGVVTVDHTAAGIYKEIKFVPYRRTYVYRTSTQEISGALFPWSKAGYDQGSVPNASNIFALFPGVHVIGSNADAATMTNLPEARAGLIFVGGSSTSGMKQIEFWPYDKGYHYSTVNAATDGSMRPWDKEYPNTSIPNVALRRDLLVDQARRRRGGTIGTAGKAAIALRFDHWLTDFKAKVMPLLEQYSLPGTQAIIPSLVGQTGNVMTWTELQNWCLTGGGELFNHGLGDHVGTNVESEYETQILQGLSGVKTGAPRIAVEGWNSPGVGIDSWGGFAPMETYDRWSTIAGQLVLANHAVASGSIGNVYRDLDGSNPIGPQHLSIEGSTPSKVKVTIDRLVKTGTGGVLMLHPNMLDQAGKMTTAALGEVLAYIAQLRDEGKLEVLSQSGLHFADSGSARRSNWIWNGNFATNLADWVGTGYTRVVEGEVAFARSTAAASTLVQTGIVPDIGLGSQRELVYQVRATDGATVRLKAGLTSKDVVIPASPDWQTVRAFTTIPLDYVLPWIDIEVGRVAGGTVDIADIRLQSI